jgi:hypothetical protein
MPLPWEGDFCRWIVFRVRPLAGSGSAQILYAGDNLKDAMTVYETARPETGGLVRLVDTNILVQKY